MATELNEAKIRVILDLPKGEPRKPGQPDEPGRRPRDRDEDRNAPGRGSTSQRRVAIRDLTYGNLTDAVRGVLSSLPFIGAGFAGGIAAAELIERYGPAIQGAVNEAIEERIPAEIKKVMDALGISLPNLSDVSREWSEIKAALTALSAGADKTFRIAAAVKATGGELSLEEAARLFDAEKRLSNLEITVEKDRLRKMRENAGATAGRAVIDGLAEALRTVGR